MNIEMGEMRTELAKNLMRNIENVISQRLNRKDPYYILVHTKFHPADPLTINTKIVVMEDRPPKLVGTILFRVDNQLGRLERIWVIPADVPDQSLYEREGEPCQEILRSVSNMADVFLP